MSGLSKYQAEHFLWDVSGTVATLTLNRPNKKNPLTFESYAELRELFQNLRTDKDIKAVVLTGAGGNFCAGGDVFEIIEPLTKRDPEGQLEFTRMTGAVVQAMRECPQPIVAAVDGICAGAGACLAMASDIRLATTAAKTAFLFVRVGLAGCDMGACAMLPRIIGQGRASEWLFTGRMINALEAEKSGFYNRLVGEGDILSEAQALAETLASGPTQAHAMTKRMLNEEWDMGLNQAIEAEAVAQAECMQTKDFTRAFEAFAKRETPVFKGD